LGQFFSLKQHTIWDGGSIKELHELTGNNILVQ